MNKPLTPEALERLRKVVNGPVPFSENVEVIHADLFDLFFAYEAMREALKPFAECAALFDAPKFTDEDLPDDEVLIADGAFAEIEDKRPLTFGDFRRARAALTEGGES